MAQQVASTLHERINRLLDLSFREWERLPAVEGEIDGWDLLEQIDFVEEWTLAEERLLRLARYANDGALTPPQEQRYREIMVLVVRHRPIITRLRAS